jgi:hypothetical protein
MRWWRGRRSKRSCLLLSGSLSECLSPRGRRAGSVIQGEDSCEVLSSAFDRPAVGAENAMDGALEPGILLVAGRVRRVDVGVGDLRRGCDLRSDRADGLLQGGPRSLPDEEQRLRLLQEVRDAGRIERHNRRSRIRQRPDGCRRGLGDPSRGALGCLHADSRFARLLASRSALRSTTVHRVLGPSDLTPQ